MCPQTPDGVAAQAPGSLFPLPDQLAVALPMDVGEIRLRTIERPVSGDWEPDFSAEFEERKDRAIRIDTNVTAHHLIDELARKIRIRDRPQRDPDFVGILERLSQQQGVVAMTALGGLP